MNYRGSNGRGSAYQKAIFADWGNKEVVDLLGAMDHVEKLGFVDPDRLGIGGWSYGGILTNYTIATRQALQGGDERRRQLEPDFDVRHRSVHPAVRARARAAVEDAGPLDEGLVSVLPRRSDQDADAVPVR